MGRQEDLDRFYGLMDELRQRVGGFRSLRDARWSDGWPRQGVYFFFEPGELRADGRTPRVVRVGTHGVAIGTSSSLWGRLAQHKGHVGGLHAGGGSHRGSVFRRHVGAALLQRDGDSREPVPSWGAKSAHGPAARAAEYPVEIAVSEIIRNMPLLWVAVTGAPGSTSDRRLIEAGAIALLSNWGRPELDPPSAGWLGRHSPYREVAESGLWNVQHVDDEYSPVFLDVLAAAVRSTGVPGGVSA